MMRVRLDWHGPDVLAAVEAAGERGIRDCAQFILDESRKQVPLDTGALSRSGAVDVQGLSGTVSYDTPYAVRWHEQQANFQRGRKNKYLEDPLNDRSNVDKMIKHLRSLM